MAHTALRVCRPQKPEPRIKYGLTIRSDILELFDKKIEDREEENRSSVVERLICCYIYSTENGECDEACPYYEEESANGKKS
jgi:hypothetical protein